MCEKGERVEQNIKKAIELYLIASDLGHSEAQWRLTNIYLAGLGVEKNADTAYKFAKMSADNGNPLAQFLLGYRYAKGDGIAVNMVEAVHWFQLAANQGLAEAQYYLGICYSSDMGITQDFFEAAKWYKKAAAQGHLEAMNQLGLIFYLLSKGDIELTCQAYVWLSLAIANGNTDSMAYRNKLAEKLPFDILEKAQQRVEILQLNFKRLGRIE